MGESRRRGKFCDGGRGGGEIGGRDATGSLFVGNERILRPLVICRSRVRAQLTRQSSRSLVVCRCPPKADVEIGCSTLPVLLGCALTRLRPVSTPGLDTLAARADRALLCETKRPISANDTTAVPLWAHRRGSGHNRSHRMLYLAELATPLDLSKIIERYRSARQRCTTEPSR